VALYRKLNAAETQHTKFLCHFLLVLEISASYVTLTVVTSDLYTALQAVLERLIGSTYNVKYSFFCKK